MNFIVNNGPFIKDKNNVQKIMLTNLLTLLPFIIYRSCIDGINSIALFIISIISSIFVSIMYDYVRNIGDNLTGQILTHLPQLIHSCSASTFQSKATTPDSFLLITTSSLSNA